MEKADKFYYWLPRIFCILAILFVSMFAMDSFSPELTLKQQVIGFLIHLIPSYVLIALLVIAWRWEYIGGVIFTIFGVLFSATVFFLNFDKNRFTVSQSLMNAIIIGLPFVLVGLLFIYNSRKSKKA